MKGLTLNCLGRKEEAYEYVRRGLRNDLKSHVCWHVYGLLQRSDHKYDEAIKCYRNALKWDRDNIQILRDLSLLQIQMRDLEGYRDTRYQLLHLRPTQRASWIGYAMSYHLLEDYEMAAKILEEFRKTTSNSQNKGMMRMNNSKGPIIDYEHSELILYQIMVLKEGGYYNEAYDHLIKYGETEVCDKLAVHEHKAELLLLLGRNREAIKVIKENLIARNPENVGYYKQLETAMGLSENNEEERLKLYTEYQFIYPKSQMCFRLPLNFITSRAQFESSVDYYLKRGFRKGQPALFRDLKPLYIKELEKQSVSRNQCDFLSSLPWKIEVIQNLVLKYNQNLRHSNSFENNQECEDATCILWVNYFLSQHFDFLGNFEKALVYVNEAIDHTPTLIELFVIKAKIYKHAGNIEEAVACVDEAQSLDTADRYLNSKCAKYLLRANRIQEAEEICSKFTREGVCASDNLNEMQCMWFQSESALAYQRLGQWGEALKKCIEIDRHFAEITEDQFDFHTYCMRKMTLRSYVALLRLEDVLKYHPFYFTAARIAIEVYLRLYDKPLGDNEMTQDVNPANVSASELKKIISKQRKAKKKQAAANLADNQSHNHAQGQSINQANSNSSGEKSETGLSSETWGEKLIPSKLERTPDPLNEALKFLKPLQQLAKDRIETHLLAFEIYYRRQKCMLMLQSLKRALKLDRNNSTLNRQLILFYNFVELNRDNLCDPLKEVLDLEMEKLIGTNPEKITSALDLNERFLQQNADSLIHRIESSKIVAMLKKDCEEEKKNSFNSINTDLEKMKDLTIDNCTQMIKCLKDGIYGSIDDNTIDGLISRCHRIFPYATPFLPASKKKSLQVMNSCSKENTINYNLNDNQDGNEA